MGYYYYRITKEVPSKEMERIFRTKDKTQIFRLFKVMTGQKPTAYEVECFVGGLAPRSIAKNIMWIFNDEDRKRWRRKGKYMYGPEQKNEAEFVRNNIIQVCAKRLRKEIAERLKRKEEYERGEHEHELVIGSVKRPTIIRNSTGNKELIFGDYCLMVIQPDAKPWDGKGDSFYHPHLPVKGNERACQLLMDIAERYMPVGCGVSCKNFSIM